jgi:hypothetical protein
MMDGEKAKLCFSTTVRQWESAVGESYVSEKQLFLVHGVTELKIQRNDWTEQAREWALKMRGYRVQSCMFTTH